MPARKPDRVTLPVPKRKCVKPLEPLPPDHPELRERRIVPESFATMVEMAQRYRATNQQWEE